MGQQTYLPPGTEFVRGRYEPPRPGWDHDHCVMCSTKFGSANLPDSVTEGFTTMASSPSGEGYCWVCPACFTDFAEEFAWTKTTLRRGAND